MNKEQSEYIPLRPITLAIEDKCQIVAFFVETFQRLSVASEVASLTQLWEKIDAVLTDTASKCLRIAKVVSQELQSKNVPISLLCKAHVCEKIDKVIIDVIMKYEVRLDIRNKLEKVSKTTIFPQVIKECSRVCTNCFSKTCQLRW